MNSVADHGKQRAALLASLGKSTRQFTVFPLSFGQERLWFLERVQESAAAYQMLSATRLEGDLDADALAATLERIVERHEILRTVFPSVDGEPVQLVSKHGQVKLDRQDFQHPSAPKLEEAIAEQVRERFDLGEGPLLRARLLHTAEREHVLVLTMHHIVSDDWSMGVLLREMALGYQAAVEKRDWPLKPLRVQYGDFAAWQREHLHGEFLAAQLRYWRKQLDGIEALQLPWERARPAVQSYCGGRLRVQLSGDLVRGLHALAQREGATLYMALLAAWQVLLARYSNQEDIAVGSPVANRKPVEVEDLIGFFVNTLVLRTDLHGEPAFREVLRRVKRVCLEAYEHQEAPFERVVEELRPERTLSYTPLFQVMLSLQNTPRTQPAMGSLRLSPVRIESEAAPFDLLLSLTGTPGGGLQGMLNYSRDVFSRSAMERLLTHWAKLLEGLVREPDRVIWQVPLLDERERQQVRGYSAESHRPTDDKSWLDQFEAAVHRNPDAPAIVGHCSYRELNETANRIANWLRAQAAAPEQIVAVAIERSPELIAAWLGVWKAGAAVLPLDPNWPSERLASVVKQAQPTAFIAGRKDLALSNLPLLDIDDTEALQAYSPHHISKPHTHTQLAYLLFTSGSTGSPKGVMVHHGAFAEYMQWCLETYDLTQGAGSLVHSSITFDLTLTSIFAPLICGKPLHLIDPRGGLDAFCNALQATCNLTLLKLTPAHLEIVSASLTPQQIQTCTRVLIVGGDALTTEAIAPWRKHAPLTRIFNEYGPTEATVGCCVFEIPHDMSDTLVPIGRPITNARIYILDRELQPVPIGVLGEIFIGGPTVARGYLHDPALTAARFIPDPFSPSLGARMYQSGDIARFRTDGCIEFLGRRDGQVKLRGFRIELAEIEQALRRHPEVKEAVAVVLTNSSGQKQLCAYVVDGTRTLDCTELLQMLRSHLPSSMIPSAIVPIDHLPLNSNGKVDRARLPEPPIIEVKENAPRNECESKILVIWRDVLGREKIGIEQTFFELGGNSLLLVKVHARLKHAFDSVIPLSDLFRFPTVASLARLLSGTADNLDNSAVDRRAARQKQAINARKAARTQNPDKERS